jgi:diguanylate cyclase (GGDEF)-like protein/PAS domain S-box-containing protein
VINDILHTLFNIVTQFTGAQGQYIVVNYVIASAFYLMLISVAKSRDTLLKNPSEKTLIWAFSFGFCRELLMVGIAFIQTLHLTSITPTIFPLIEHISLNFTLVLISVALLRCFIDNSAIWLRFLKFSLTISLAISAVVTIWWLNLSAAQNHIDFEQSWANWALHVNCVFWTLSSMVILLKNKQPNAKTTVLISLSIFALTALLPLADILTAHSSSYTYSPISKLCYLIAIFTLGYVYIQKSMQDHAHMQTAIETNETKLSTMLSAINDLVWLKDQEGVFLACNAAFEKFFNAKEVDILGKTDYDFVDKELADFFRQNDRAAIAKGSPSVNEEWISYPDGQRALLETTKTPLLSSSGILIGVLGIAHDITARKQAELALQQSEEQLSIIYDNVNDVIFSISVEPNNQFRFTSINQNFTLTTGLSKDQVVGKLVTEVIPEPSCSAAIDKYKQCAESKQILHWEELSIDPKGEKNGEVSISPILDKNNRCIQIVGTVHDISERKQWEKTLKENEEQFHTILNISQDGFTVNDLSTRFLEVNDAFCHMLGYSREELLQMKTFDICNRDPAEIVEHAKRVMQQGHDLYEAKMRRKDGSIIDVAANIIYSNKYHDRFYAFTHDITKRKKTEANILSLHLEQQAMLDNDQVAILKVQDRTIIWANPAAEKMNGSLPGSMLGKSTREFYLDEETYANVGEAAINAMKTGGIYRTQIQVYKETKEVIWVDISCSILNASQSITLWTLLNITENKKNEARIEKLKKTYQALSEVNQAIVRIEHQSELFPLVCRCAVEFGGMQTAWIAQLDEPNDIMLQVAKYGENLELVETIHISANANSPFGTGPGGVAMRENHPIIMNDTETLHGLNAKKKKNWKSIATFPIYKNGKPNALLCVCHSEVQAFDEEMIALLTEMSSDISFAIDNFNRESQRQQAEEANRLAASIYQASSEAMIISDANGEIIDVNPAFTDITGYSKLEVLGKNCNILESKKHDEEMFINMHKHIATTGKFQGESWAIGKNGDAIPVWMTTNNIYNDDGSLRYQVSLFTDISLQKKSEELIWHQAHIDALTDLPNRRTFLSRLDQEIHKSNRTGQPLALLYLDIDRFKEVNDTLGHATGDLLLQEAAKRLSHCVRDFDVISRLGGDEFTLILTASADLVGVDRVANAILKSLAEPYYFDNDVIYVSASIGITLYPIDASNAEELLKNADQAMYAAKNAGRNQSSYFTPLMQQAAKKRMRLAADLRVALQNNQIWVAYQPIVDLRTHEIIKAEALARWNHPTLGFISPAEFIPIAENTGLIMEIGDWIFQQALHQLKYWQDMHYPEFQLSINMSPIQLQDKSPKSAAYDIEQLNKLGLSGKSVVIEITEGILLDANITAQEKLFGFRDAGIQVALDDFGTGYSSMSYLQKFDIDFIKIDQSFTRNLTKESSTMALCEAIIVMAHKLGMQVIAEGIETEEQKYLLSLAGCDYGQGYLFSKPITHDEFDKLLSKTQQPRLI